MSNPLFGIVPAGQPLITEPTSTPTPTSLLYALPTAKPFSHVVVLLLPGANLPDSTAAAIYLATARDVAAATAAGQAPSFTFLGGIGPGKESAVFKIASASAPADLAAGLVIGVAVEPADSVAQRVQALAAEKPAAGAAAPPTTAVLAQRIIQNAFNFLASFSGTAGPGGVEIVPLKAFEDWWRKFESRVRSDPSFLEKQSD